MHENTIKQLEELEASLRGLPDANYEEIQAAQSASQARACLVEAESHRQRDTQPKSGE